MSALIEFASVRNRVLDMGDSYREYVLASLNWEEKLGRVKDWEVGSVWQTRKRGVLQTVQVALEVMEEGGYWPEIHPWRWRGEQALAWNIHLTSDIPEKSNPHYNAIDFLPWKLVSNEYGLAYRGMDGGLCQFTSMCPVGKGGYGGKTFTMEVERWGAKEGFGQTVECGRWSSRASCFNPHLPMHKQMVEVSGINWIHAVRLPIMAVWLDFAFFCENMASGGEEGVECGLRRVIHTRSQPAEIEYAVAPKATHESFSLLDVC